MRSSRIARFWSLSEYSSGSWLATFLRARVYFWLAIGCSEPSCLSVRSWIALRTAAGSMNERPGPSGEGEATAAGWSPAGEVWSGGPSNGESGASARLITPRGSSSRSMTSLPINVNRGATQI
jgi:hypothetical protein